jgi:hypothetical protein
MPNVPIDDITVIESCKDPQESPVWSSIFGDVCHPELQQPIFIRHNGSPVNIIDLYHGETCYLIGRGPSIGKFLENEEIKSYLMNPAIVKYCMNSSPALFGYNCNIWTAVDAMTKFPKQILKNPNILKLIPMNRYYNRGYSITKGKEDAGTIAYEKKRTACCPNTIGVNSFLLSDDVRKTLNFADAFLRSPSILYGYYKGYKSVLLFSLKIALLLGFHKIVFVGIDFDMKEKEPYYKQTLQDYSKFHIEHNNKLYVFLSDIIKNIYGLLEKKAYGYNVKLLTANSIQSMPFIPTVDLNLMLKNEITAKLQG